MTRLMDMTGQRFGRWMVLGRTGNKNREAAWLCRCDCGYEAAVRGAALRKGESTSCGCYQREVMARVATKHGHAVHQQVSATYISWKSMRSRCNDPNATGYERYGGRGITVCDRWDVFENFLEDMGERPFGRSLDRIDNEQGYFKANCRWATSMRQRHNQREAARWLG